MNFGSGAQHFERIEDLQDALEKELDANTTVLVKGSRFMKMERVVEQSVLHRCTEEEPMLLALAQWLAQDIRFFSVFNYITLRTVLAAMTALVISFHGRSDDDTQTDRLQDRPVGAQRRAANASGQGRHADHGRRADPDFDRDHHPAVGRFAQPLRVGGVAHHAGLRRDRLGG